VSRLGLFVVWVVYGAMKLFAMFVGRTTQPPLSVLTTVWVDNLGLFLAFWASLTVLLVIVWIAPRR